MVRPGCGQYFNREMIVLIISEQILSVRALSVRERQMPEGTVKKIVADKGFGFIQGDSGDVFFHYTALNGVEIESLQEGDQVTFEMGQGPKGPRAENVQRV